MMVGNPTSFHGGGKVANLCPPGAPSNVPALRAPLARVTLAGHRLCLSLSISMYLSLSLSLSLSTRETDNCAIYTRVACVCTHGMAMHHASQANDHDDTTTTTTTTTNDNHDKHNYFDDDNNDDNNNHMNITNSYH